MPGALTWESACFWPLNNRDISPPSPAGKCLPHRGQPSTAPRFCTRFSSPRLPARRPLACVPGRPPGGAQSLQSCPSLWPKGYCPPGSSVHGILQPEILKWAAMPSSRGRPDQGSNPHLPCLPHCRQILYRWATGKVPFRHGAHGWTWRWRYDLNSLKQDDGFLLNEL